MVYEVRHPEMVLVEEGWAHVGYPAPGRGRVAQRVDTLALAHVSRREVPGDLAWRKLPSRMLESSAHAHAAFLHRAGTETDEVISGKAVGDVDLGAYSVRVDSEDRC